MDLNSDLIDLLRALNAEGAKYKLRATKDADIFIGTDRENAQSVWNALSAFGAPLEELQVQDLTIPHTFFIMGRAPNQIDIITTIDGVTFDRAWENRFAATYGGVQVNYIGKADLISNKEAAGRPQDRVDVEYLRNSRE